MSSEASSQASPSTKAKRLPLKQLGKQYMEEFKKDDLTGMAAEIAYYLIFAIPPMLILLVMGAAILNAFTDVPVVENLRDMVTQNAPETMQDVLNSVINNAVAEVDGGLASVGAIFTALLAIWSASNGVGAFMKGFNRTYDVVESRGFVKKKAVAIGLTLLMAVLVNLAFALFVFGGDIGGWIAEQVGLGSVFTTVWNIARWPVAIIFVMLMLAVLYYLGPAIEQSFQWISPGSILATLLWVVAVFGFQFYLALSDPGSAYGAFGGLIVFLFFLYISGLIFLLGAELNAVLQKRYDEETVAFRAENPELLEDEETQREARTRARQHDRREGTDITEGAGSSSAPDARGTGRPRTTVAPNAKRGEQGGFGARLGGIVAALIVVLVGWLSRRRSRQS